MAAWVAAACAILLSCCYLSLAQSPSSAPAMAPSVGSDIPTLRIQSRIPLPSLPILQDSYTLNIGISRIVGPGDNTSADDPYVEYTGRTYNHLLVPGLVRVKQGNTMRAIVCNTLPSQVNTINSSFDYGFKAFPLTGGQSYKDPNIAAHHFHGHYGNPGTNNEPCDPLAPAGNTCYRGDNIFADIMPGKCNEYQYDISPVTSPGTFWMHPHHQGSTSLMMQTCSLPVVLDENPSGGFDFLDTPSCAPFRRLFTPDNEVIMHMQTFMMAVEPNNTDLPDPSPGPTDDGYIAVAEKSIPQDPFCCSGPNKDELGQGNWDDVNGANSTGDGWVSVSEEPFYVSGQNSQFTVINGVYQPIISMTAGQVYRWRLVQASTMKWMDLSLNGSGCHWGIYSRDGNFLRSFPRMTDHIVMSAANRVEVMIVCDPGTYRLQTGQGPLDVDPDCGSSHCELLNQTTLATLEVSAQGGYPINASAPFGASTCEPQFPGYLQDLRTTPASEDKMSNITFKGIMNFTNSQQSAGPNSGNCLINSLINNEQEPMQEVIGEVTELFVDNIDQHPYHHHVQPYQIVALGNDTDEMNGWWRVGDYVDTLLLPSSGLKNATVRWVPGPGNITGVGYALLHCHISPHSDEGCIMKTQILEKTYQEPYPGGLSNGAAAGITLAVLVVFCVAVIAPIAWCKRQKRLRREEARRTSEDTRARLVTPEQEEEKLGKL